MSLYFLFNIYVFVPIWYKRNSDASKLKRHEWNPPGSVAAAVAAAEDAEEITDDTAGDKRCCCCCRRRTGTGSENTGLAPAPAKATFHTNAVERETTQLLGTGGLQPEPEPEPVPEPVPETWLPPVPWPHHLPTVRSGADFFRLKDIPGSEQYNDEMEGLKGLHKKSKSKKPKSEGTEGPRFEANFDRKRSRSETGFASIGNK